MTNLSIVTRDVQPYCGSQSAIRKARFRPLLAALLMAAGPLCAETSLQNNTVAIGGPIQVRMAYPDRNGNSQEYQIQQVPAAVSKVFPSQLLQLQNTSLLQAAGSPNGYFDQLWSNVRGEVCGDLMEQIPALINSGDNQVSMQGCTMNTQGLFQANITDQWIDKYGFTINGTRLVLDYLVPLNSITFSVSTRCTGGIGAPDPTFTVEFGVHLVVTSSSVNSPVLTVPPVVESSGVVVFDALYTGDYSSQIQSAAQQWALALGQFLVLNIPPSWADLVGLAVSLAQLLEQLGAIAYADICNSQLPDQVSSDLSFIGSLAAGGAAWTAGRDVDRLFQGLYAAQPLGFRQLEVTAGDDDSLIFRLTYPAPAAPNLQDARTVSNPYNFAPTITSGETAVAPGQNMIIAGNYFKPAYTTNLIVNWDKKVWGPPQTGVWIMTSINGIPIPIGPIPTSQLFFEATKLSPGTAYSFIVQECDQITCAPWSNWLKTSTDSSGTDQVTLTLDNPNSPAIGPNATAGPDGKFADTVTIPAQTTSGTHTVYATLGKQQAKLPIQVCVLKVCPPALDVRYNGAALQAGSHVEIGMPITLHGSNFTAGQTVTLSVDSFQGTKIGYTTVGNDGTFTATFTMPSVPVGSHNLVATQSGNGQTLEASVNVIVDTNLQ